MGTENQNNRSTAPTPEFLAMMNATIAAAVREAVAGAVVLMQSQAITPEKLREALAPAKDDAKTRREIREKLKFKKEEIENAKAARLKRDNCNHRYTNGQLAISTAQNFFDRQARGICMLCHDWITPREWVIDAPTGEDGEGVARLAPKHKDYELVLQKLREQNG